LGFWNKISIKSRKDFGILEQNQYKIKMKFNIDTVQLDPIAKAVLPIAAKHGWHPKGGFVRDCLIRGEEYNDLDLYSSYLSYQVCEDEILDKVITQLKNLDNFHITVETLTEDNSYYNRRKDEDVVRIAIHLKRITITLIDNPSMFKQVDFVLVKNSQLTDKLVSVQCFDCDEISYIDGALICDVSQANIISKIVETTRARQANFISWEFYLNKLMELEIYVYSRRSINRLDPDLFLERVLLNYFTKVNKRVQQKIDRKWTMDVKRRSIFEVIDGVNGNAKIDEHFKEFLSKIGTIIERVDNNYIPKVNVVRQTITTAMQTGSRYVEGGLPAVPVIRIIMIEACPNCSKFHKPHTVGNLIDESYMPDVLKLRSEAKRKFSEGNILKYTCRGKMFEMEIAKIM
jgi:hypothetical protein